MKKISSLLERMYLTHAPSFHEKKLAKIVKRELQLMGIPYDTDSSGQIYSLKHARVPLVCAHLDTVSYVVPLATKLRYAGKMVFGNGVIGADDKNGVYIILRLLRRFPDLNFIFSVQEETASDVLFKLLCKNEKKTEKIPYALVLDRRGDGDIIGTQNEYCNEDLENAIVEIGKRFDFKPSCGVFSDANTIREFVACVNLSVSYEDAHTIWERTNLIGLENTFHFVCTIIKEIPKSPKYSLAEYNLFSDCDDAFFDYVSGKWEKERPDVNEKPVSGKCTVCGDFDFLFPLPGDDGFQFYACPDCFDFWVGRESFVYRKGKTEDKNHFEDDTIDF